MSKMIQAASAVALAAATTTAFAWYGAPCQTPVAGPVPTQEQQQAMAEQQQAYMEQQGKAMQAAFEAQRKFAEEQMARMRQAQPQPPEMPAFADRQFPAMPEMPAMPPMPKMGEYPSFPEFPAGPEFGQYPSMPEMPAMAFPNGPDSMQDRLKEMDAYRAEAKKRMDERREAMKSRNEQRRAMHPGHRHAFRMPTYGMDPGACQDMMGAPAPQQQAAGPDQTGTITQ